ncbi:IS110 family transposase [Collinsella sp. TF08-11AT]|nr:IS110 family transposase [Collinsella sp. TF08-11AT]
MDVHLRSTTVCALDAETGEAVTRRFRGNPWGEVAEWMSGFPGPSLAAYESGYLGFAPQRELSGLGVDCVVAARMAKAILSHDVTPVWVPSPEIEGLRDLAAAHDAATARLAAAKQRLLAFLARRGYVYGGTTPAGNPRKYWTYGFLRWLDGIHPADDGGIRALAALRNEVEAADETREALLAEYRAAVAAGPLSAEAEALQSIKGCGFALAAAFASEVGDFSRFRSGRQVTAYFGLAPKQRSSADSVRLGGISGAGNALVRKLAVEGSWCYAQAGHQPKLMPKGSGVPLEIRMHGRKGSERLLRRREEMIARGMPQAKANAATAAELVRWLWALGTMCREGAE